MSEQPPRISPKPFNAPPQGLWRATPPAIFPPILGLFGLGLAWRKAANVMGTTSFIGEMILGAVTLLFFFAVVAYMAKVIRRPGAFIDDLRILPGRAGLSAASAAGLLFAATLVPYSTPLSRIVLIAALIAHVIVALSIVYTLITGPAEQRRVTPVWHLTFVGFILAPLSAVPLGWLSFSQMIFATTLPIAGAIWLISALQFMRADVPPPLRPLLAIHLAPVSLFGIVSSMLGYEGLVMAFGYIGLTALVVYILGARYLTKADFSALWGAFTFPMAALANLMFSVALVQARDGLATWSLFPVAGGLILVAATLAIAYIASKVLQLWAKGKLSKATNASRV